MVLPFQIVNHRLQSNLCHYCGALADQCGQETLASPCAPEAFGIWSSALGRAELKHMRSATGPIHQTMKCGGLALAGAGPTWTGSDEEDLHIRKFQESGEWQQGPRELLISTGFGPG